MGKNDNFLIQMLVAKDIKNKAITWLVYIKVPCYTSYFIIKLIGKDINMSTKLLKMVIDGPSKH